MRGPGRRYAPADPRRPASTPATPGPTPTARCSPRCAAHTCRSIRCERCKGIIRSAPCSAGLIISDDALQARVPAEYYAGHHMQDSECCRSAAAALFITSPHFKKKAANMQAARKHYGQTWVSFISQTSYQCKAKERRTGAAAARARAPAGTGASSGRACAGARRRPAGR